MKFEQLVKDKKIGMMISYLLLVIDSVIGIFYTPLLIGALGSTQYGLYDIVNSITAYIAIADIGLGGAITRYIIKYNTKQEREKEKNCITTAIFTYFVIASVCLVAGVIIVILFPYIVAGKAIGTTMGEAQTLMFLSVCNIVLTLFMHAFSGIALAYSYFSLEKLLKIFKVCSRFLTVILLVQRTGKAVTLVQIDIVLTALMLTGFILFFNKVNIKLMKGKFDKALLGTMLSFTVAILFQSIINQINTTAGKLIIGARVTDLNQVTVYGIVTQIYLIYCSMSTVIQNIYYPSVGRAVFEGKSKKDVTKLVSKASRIQSGIQFIILIGFWVFGREFVDLWVGIESRKIWICAAVLLTVATLHLSQNTVSCILKAKNKLRPKTIILGCGALVTLVIGIVFSGIIDPIYAVVGAVITGIALFDALALNIYFVKGDIIDLPLFMKNFFKGYWIVVPLTLLAALGINTVLPHGTWIMLGIKIVLTVIVYGILMLVVGLTKEEKNQVLKIIKR